MKNTPPDGLIEFTIDEVSDIDWNDTIEESTEVVVQELHWKATVFFDENSVGASIICTHNQLAPWSIDIDAEYALVHPGGGKNITAEGLTEKMNNKNNAVHGKPIITKEQLFKDKKYINDDEITFEIRFWISNKRGIKIVHQIDFYAPNEPFNDVALLIEGEKIYASKQILAASSPVFKAMFYGDFAERNKNEMELNDVDREEFIELLRMIYPSNRTVRYDSGEFLIKLADRFQMECVIERVEMFLMDSECVLSIATKLKTAEEYRLSALKEHCLGNLKTVQDVKSAEDSSEYGGLSDEMKAAILERKQAIIEENARMERQSTSDDSSGSD